MFPKITLYFFLSCILMITACSLEPKPIQYGQDQCSFCKMTISDSRYGSELITKKGKIYKFDSAECLTHFSSGDEIPKDNIHRLLITDFATPENFVDADSAWFLVSPNLSSPMGAGLTGFKNKTEAEKFLEIHSGEILQWNEVQKTITGTTLDS